jgi:hypothetical protein
LNKDLLEQILGFGTNLQHAHSQGKDKGRKSLIKLAESLAILVCNSPNEMNRARWIGRQRYLARASISFSAEVMVSVRRFPSSRVEVGAANFSHLSSPTCHTAASQISPKFITNGQAGLDLPPEKFFFWFQKSYSGNPNYDPHRIP